MAGVAFAEPKYVEAARRAADFILTDMRDQQGRLLHTWRAGEARLAAYLDDYAGLACALMELYQATYDEKYLATAGELIDTLLARFGDESAGFYFTADDHEQLLTRNRDFTDNATPSGNAQAATALLQLASITDRGDFAAAGEAVLNATGELMQRIPHGVGQMLLAADWFIGPVEQYVFVGTDAAELAREAAASFSPRRLVLWRDTSAASGPADPLFAQRAAVNGQAALYVCHGQTCDAPVVGVDAIRGKLAE